MAAPILLGYACRVCGLERLQQPWDAADGFTCANCGATNKAPLLSTAERDRTFADAMRSVAEQARKIAEALK